MMKSPSVKHAREGCDRRRCDDRDRGRAHTAHDRRYGERQLDPRDHAEFGHAHAARRLDGVAVHLANADERVDQDRRDADDPAERSPG